MAPWVTEEDLKGRNTPFINPKIFVEKAAAADEVAGPSARWRKDHFAAV